MEQWASAIEHERYALPLASRKRCRQSANCTNRVTHRGMANGVCLMSGCEFHVYRWVRNPWA